MLSSLSPAHRLPIFRATAQFSAMRDFNIFDGARVHAAFDIMLSFVALTTAARPVIQQLPIFMPRRRLSVAEEVGY